MRWIWIILLLLIIGAFIIGFLIGRYNGDITGRVVEDVDDSYSWTKAICDDNKCVDVKVDCSNGKVVKIELVSELVEYSDDWVDERLDKDKLC